MQSHQQVQSRGRRYIHTRLGRPSNFRPSGRPCSRLAPGAIRAVVPSPHSCCCILLLSMRTNPASHSGLVLSATARQRSYSKPVTSRSKNHQAPYSGAAVLATTLGLDAPTLMPLEPKVGCETGESLDELDGGRFSCPTRSALVVFADDPTSEVRSC
jgi:hypothetical protein